MEEKVVVVRMLDGRSRLDLPSNRGVVVFPLLVTPLDALPFTHPSQHSRKLI